MLKKIMSCVLAVLLCSISLFANGSNEASSEKTKTALRVGTMPNALGLPVHQAELQNYFKDAGLDVEVSLFATGAPINEAMSADAIDLAVSGMASVYSLATGNFTYVGDGCITVSGEAIYARKDSPITKVKGESKLEGVLGSTKLVKGISILGPLATTAHFQAIKYVESFGLTSEDFNMVSMDYAQAYQAFVTGQGDLIATIPPYNTQLEDAGYVKVCDISKVLGGPLVDALFVNNKVLKERPEDVQAFVSCYYKACEELVNDPKLRSDVGIKWYGEEGRNFSKSDMESEIAQKSYHTKKTLMSDNYPFGATMTNIGAFFATQGMIQSDKVPNILKSIDDEFAKKYLETLK